MSSTSAETELLIVRHGETQWNAEGRVQGSGDSSLTVRGLSMAKALASRLRSGRKEIHACYASPLGRAYHTAQILCSSEGGVNLPITREPRLAERSFGVLEGLTDDEQRQMFPQVKLAISAGDDDYAPPGGGESKSEVRARVLEALDEIVRAHPGQRVLIVTHGAVLGTIARSVLGLSHSAAMEKPNCVINLLRWRKGKWEIAIWGDAGEFCAVLPHGEWLVDTSAALRLIGMGFVLGAIAGTLWGAALASRRRQ
ncbi:hypothetical protein AB1Y20_021332 [Prymnesium parvum]|uniref:Phosphoglycerate mutase (2,3-diphosphoglycerate-dependent) n=1 Tax=Prymnesium parvum TaxID=97485 RepID=A0AB34JLS1_PRYPA